jgi:hypothetical protein
MEIALRHETAAAIRVRKPVVESEQKPGFAMAGSIGTPQLREASR